MAKMNSQFTIDEEQEMEKQPIYQSSGENKNSAAADQRPYTYNAITQLVAAQHEQISSSGNIALQYPTTPNLR